MVPGSPRKLPGGGLGEPWGSLKVPGGFSSGSLKVPAGPWTVHGESLGDAWTSLEDPLRVPGESLQLSCLSLGLKREEYYKQPLPREGITFPL